MAAPHLTFYTELDKEALQALFDESLIEDLKSMRAAISLGILDLSPERAGVVQQLNQAGIPVVAWLLLPEGSGYWFNLDNALEAEAFYKAFRVWTDQHKLQWKGIGLDIEPDIRVARQWVKNKWRVLPKLLRDVLNFSRLKSARKAYRRLIADIHSDGYTVESYQHFFIEDERRAGSTLIQRVLGIVDLPVDREVWMLYSSSLRPNSAGILWSYAPQAQAIGLGSTGGGVQSSTDQRALLKWGELARDLRLAWYWSNELYIFSLEGCVEQGFIERLKTFEWDQPILFPEEMAEKVNAWRGVLHSILWLSSHFAQLLLGLAGTFFVYRRLRHFILNRRQP